MKLCKHNCVAACDFCVHFDFNGEDLVEDNGRVWPGALYVGKGWCRLYQRPMDPGQMCADFECIHYSAAPGPDQKE